ncbi:MAG: heme biosynthesis HemY N-terminal domain-containing protein [Holosporales bacterium]
MRRLILPLAALILLLFGLSLLIPGTVRLEIGDTEIKTQGAFLGLALLLVILLSHGVLRGIEHLAAWPARHRRHKAHTQTERGLDALSRTIEALLSRDAAKATRGAREVGTLLERPRLGLLLAAQASALNGDLAKAEHQLEQLHHVEPGNTFATGVLIRAAHSQHHGAKALHLAESSFNDNKRDTANILLYADELVRQRNTAELARLIASWPFRWHVPLERRRRFQAALAFFKGNARAALDDAAAGSALQQLALKKIQETSPEKMLALLSGLWTAQANRGLTALLWEQLRVMPGLERGKKIAALVKKQSNVIEKARLEYLAALQEGQLDKAESLRRTLPDVGAALLFTCSDCGSKTPDAALVCGACFAVDTLRLDAAATTPGGGLATLATPLAFQPPAS